MNFLIYSNDYLLYFISILGFVQSLARKANMHAIIKKSLSYLSFMILEKTGKFTRSEIKDLSYWYFYSDKSKYEISSCARSNEENDHNSHNNLFMMMYIFVRAWYLIETHISISI